MSMDAVPPCLPCPHCGLLIQEGPNPDGLAYHDCSHAHDTLKIAIGDPELTAGRTAVELMRLALMKCRDQLHEVPLGQIGKTIEACTRMAMSEGVSETGDSALLEFVRGGRDTG